MRWIIHCLTVMGLAAPLSGYAAPAADRCAGCDWPARRHDVHLTARQPRPGTMRAAPVVLTRTAVAPGRARIRPFASAPGGAEDRALALADGALRCYDLSGELVWEEHPPGLNFHDIVAIEDLDGDGRVEIALAAGRPTWPLGAALLLDAATGEVRWRYDVEPMSYWWACYSGDYLPHGAGKQLVVLMQGYPPDKRNGYLALFEFPAPGQPPVQRWRYDFDQYTCFPSLLLSDVDGDGAKELCVETHSRMWVLDALSGQVKQFLQWEVAPANVRSYGLVKFQDLNGDGREDFLCIADFAQHHEVLLNDGGKLRLAWARGWQNSVTTTKIATTYPDQPVADVDGDGRLEVVISMFNAEEEPRWMIRVYDAVTGELEARALDHIAVGVADVDGDGAAEILADESRDPTRAAVAAAAVFRIAGGQPKVVWREEGARAVGAAPAAELGAPEGRAARFLVTRGGQTYALTWDGGALLPAPYAPPPGPARADVSRISAPDGEITPPPLVRDLDGDGKPEIIHTWQGQATVYHWDRALGLAPARRFATSGDPVLADLDGDGQTDIIIGDATPTQEPVIRALRPDGAALWESRLPKTDRAGLPHGRALYFQVGRFTGKSTPDVYVLAGTPVVRSVVLDGSTGRLVWEKSEFPDIERYWGPTVNLASVYDVDGDGAEDLVFTNPDYYCAASGRTGDLIVGPIIPQKIFDQPSQGLYTLPAILEGDERTLVALCAGHYFLGMMGPRAEPYWYQLPDIGSARSGAEGFLRLPGGEWWLIGFGRENGGFACLDAATGRVRWELPLDASAGDVVACDINGDGMEEFVFGDSHGHLWAVADRGDGAAVVWKAALQASAGSPVIADLDGDGALEIIVPTGDGNLTVLAAPPAG